MRKLFYVVLIIATIAANTALAQFKNIVIDEMPGSEQGMAVSIAVNPRNTKNIVCAAGNGKIYTTFDSGSNWQKISLTSPLGIGENPIVISDSKGDLYYFHSAGDGKKYDQLICHTSKDGGKTWDEGHGFGGVPTPKIQVRMWASIDEKDNVHVAWTQKDQMESNEPNCSSTIMVSKSSNGKKWSTPITVSQGAGDCTSSGAVANAMPTVSGEGRVLVGWTYRNNMFMDRSYDGNVWLTNDIIIQTRTPKHSATLSGSHGQINSMAFVIDRSKVMTRGNLYLAYQDQVDNNRGVGVWFMKSSNFGDIWTTPMRVVSSEVSGMDQYLPVVAVDNSSGIVYVLYFSKSAETNQTDVYLSYSLNGGHSFKSAKLNEQSFTPDASINIPYIHLSASKGVIAPVWVQTVNGKIIVYTAVITQDQLLKDPGKEN